MRLPQLLAGWRVVDRIGWDAARVSQHVDAHRTYAPVFVLERPLGSEVHQRDVEEL